MHYIFLCITLLAQSGIALQWFKSPGQFDPTPKVTTLKDLGPKDVTCPNCTEIKMKNWNISISTYAEHDVISRKLNLTGEWEQKAVERACNEYQIHGGRGNMLDIGGNIGAFGLPLADCLRTHSKDKGRLIAIEAIKHNSQKFRTSIKRNSLDNIHLYEYAVSSPDANDTVVMAEHQGNHGHTVVINTASDNAPETNEYAVPVTTVDAIAKAEGDAMKKIFFLKMDIDGHEPKALQGAKEFMKDGPCLIFVEMTNTKTKETLDTGENPLDQQLFSDAAGLNAAIRTGMMLQKWGYTQFISENGTGGKEGWFRRKEWKECILRVTS